MPNLFDYMKWRGDLDFEQAELNDVDCLILSRISYLPFEGIVPETLREGILLADAAKMLMEDGGKRHYIMQADKELLPAAAAFPRFRYMRLSNFVNEVDVPAQKQFSALVIDIGNKQHFVSYRGTDDSLIGWKEDFNMSFMTQVPSQLEAVRYLEAAAPHLSGSLLLGGHSKGGNLAVYAAALCISSIQRRIKRVYNFDGPGFHAEMLSQAGFGRVKEKLRTILPQSSIVGMLLEHEEKYTIVQSSQSGYMQHDLYNWEVERDHLIQLDTVTNSSRFIDQTLKCWLKEMDASQRGAFIDGLYRIINATNSSDLQELGAKRWYEHAIAVLKAIINLDEHTRMVLGKTVMALVKAGKSNLHIYRGQELKLKKPLITEENLGKLARQTVSDIDLSA